MGIADLFRPKYRHSNVRVRTEAVRALTSDDVAILTQVARSDRDVGVRRLAIEKLDEADVVAGIAAAETEGSLRELATERAARLWTAAACGGDADDAAAALAGIIKLGDQHALVDVAVRAEQPAIRKRAFGELRDPRALADLARSEAAQDVRIAAVARIDDGDALHALAIDTTTKEVGLAAVDKLDDEGRLEHVAQKAKNKAVRQRARKIVTEMAEAERAAKPSVPDDVKRRRAEKAQLVREVEAVADSFDFARAVPIVRRAEDAWSKLAAGDDGDDRFGRATQRFWKRHEIHAEQARTADELRAVEREAAAERERQAAERAAADNAERERQAADKAERERAAAERRTRAQPSTPPTEVAAATEPAGASAPAESTTPIDRGVAVAAAMAAMLEDLEKLADGRDFRAIDRALQQASKVFEQLGKVPAAQREPLADRYTAARGKLVVKLSEAREAEDWARWNNVPKAEALISTARQFVDEEPSADLGNRLRQLQALWKEVGPMPQRRSKELWEQFKAACDQVYDKVKTFRAGEHERFAEVAVVKEALIAEAEAAAANEDAEASGATAAQLKELQARWKQSGHLPRKQGDELWKRFRAACDRFFERRRPILDAQRAEEDANLGRKQALTARAREVVAAAPGDGGWGRSIAAIKELQREWKEIGYVPRRDADRVYREFRAACDALFGLRDAARDGEANAHRAELDAVRSELAALAATGAFDDGAAIVARAVAVRAKAGELAGEDATLADAVGEMIRHVVAMHAAAVVGTELDPAAARARRAKLIGKAEELLPKPQPMVAPEADDVAAQLKQAMRANAFGSLRFSGRDPVEVVDDLRAAWRAAGPVIGEDDRAQVAEFEDVCRRALAASGHGGDRDARPGDDGERDGRRRRRDRRSAAHPAVAPASPPPAVVSIDAIVAVSVHDAVTAPAAPPPPPAPVPEPHESVAATIVATIAVPELVADRPLEVTAPLGLAGLHVAAARRTEPVIEPMPAPEPVAVHEPAPAPAPAPAVDAQADVAAAAPPRASSATLPPPPMDELDTGWDLGDDDPTATAESAAESPPSTTEPAGDGATGGDGVTDDPG